MSEFSATLAQRVAAAVHDTMDSWVKRTATSFYLHTGTAADQWNENPEVRAAFLSYVLFDPGDFDEEEVYACDFYELWAVNARRFGWKGSYSYDPVEKLHNELGGWASTTYQEYFKTLNKAVDFWKNVLGFTQSQNVRIVQAAIRLKNGLIITLPRPARHSNILMLVPPTADWRSLADEGFLLSSGEFVNRFEATVYAAKGGGVYNDTMWNKKTTPYSELFTEDLW